MPLVTPLKESEIDKKLCDFIQFFKGPLGVIPNSVRTMSRRPKVAKAFTDLNIAVMECHGAVTPEFKRIIGYVTSFVTGCRYCQAHTILGSQRFGATEERLNEAWNFKESEHYTEAEKIALEYAFAAASVPNTVDDDLSARLHQHWEDDDIVEITAVIALFGYLNRWNDSMATTLEEGAIASGESLLAHQGWGVEKHS